MAEAARLERGTPVILCAVEPRVSRARIALAQPALVLAVSKSGIANVEGHRFDAKRSPLFVHQRLRGWPAFRRRARKSPFRFFVVLDTREHRRELLKENTADA
jgi:hypothetical protein